MRYVFGLSLYWLQLLQHVEKMNLYSVILLSFPKNKSVSQDAIRRNFVSHLNHVNNEEAVKINVRFWYGRKSVAAVTCMLGNNEVEVSEVDRLIFLVKRCLSGWRCCLRPLKSCVCSV